MMAATIVKEKNHRNILERNKFFATTSIPGFGLIQSSNSRIEIIVWYVMIIFCTILTVRNIVDLTYQFKDQSPITIVSMSSINRTTCLKPLIFNLDVALPELNPEYYDVIPPSFNYSAWLNDEFKIALQYLNTKDKILYERWPYVLMPLMNKYCVFMTLCERDQEIYCYWDYIKDQLKLIERFLHHGRKLGIEFHQLHQTFGYQILNWTGFSHADKWRYFNYLLSCHGTGREGSWDTRFVFEFLPPDNATNMLGDYFEAFNRPIWHLTFDLSVSIFHVRQKLLNQSSDEVEKWYSNFSQPQISVGILTETGNYKRRPLTAKTGELKTAWFEIYSSYHIQGSCSTPMEYFNCNKKCGAKSITALCDCLPLTWETHLYGNYDWCTPVQYMKCLYNHTRDLESEVLCGQTCLQHCNHHVVNIRDHDNSDIVAGRFEIKLMGSKGLQYPRFQEVYGQSWESYLAELGGTFDFWLGASVLGGVHLVIYLIKQICYAFRKNTKTGKNVHQMLRQARNRESIPEMLTSLTIAMSTKRNYDEDDITTKILQQQQQLLQVQQLLDEERRERIKVEEELRQKIENISLIDLIETTI